MTKLLIDSDIILDIFLDRQPFVPDATKIFDLIATNAVQAYVTPVIVSNVYYMLCKMIKHDRAIMALRALVAKVEILPMDKNIILEALNSSFSDFEDALQNYSAKASKEVIIIISRNVKDYKNSSLSVMTPADFLSTFAR